MQMLDVYEEGMAKPRFRIRVPKGFTLSKLELDRPWLVVPTEDGGEVGVCLERTTRLVVRERTEYDERAYEEQQSRVVAAS